MTLDSNIPFKDQLYDILIKGFMPLAMVGAILVGAYMLIDRQMDSSEKQQSEVITRVVEKLAGMEENLNRLRRDVLRWHADAAEAAAEAKKLEEQQ